MSNPLILRHDITTTNAPAPSQLSVGELIINSITGKMYTKLVSGTVIEFVGQQVCFAKLPSISFDSVENFCCAGDILKVKVTDLLQQNSYNFEITDISGNNVDAYINTPIYSEYSSTQTDGSEVQYKEAIIPCSIAILGDKNISILKFTVIQDNKELTSRIITISCQKC
jgi:hypothetical protein